MSPVTEKTPLGAAFTPEQWADYIVRGLAAEAVVLASGATLISPLFKQVHVPRIQPDGTGWYDELEEIGPH
jgi:hypothetical protein